MKLPSLPLLTLLLAPSSATKPIIHTKQIENPFEDDTSITVLHPVHDAPRHGRRLQSTNSNDASFQQDLSPNQDLTQNQVDMSSSCSSSAQALWSLSLVTDNLPSETSWTLQRVSTNERIISGPPADQQYSANTAYDGEVCIMKGLKYIFRISDKGGDGMCCSNGNGGFVMKVDGDTFVDRMGRDEDWATKSYLFHVGNLTEVPAARPPTPPPTAMGTEEPTAILPLPPISPAPVTPAPSVAAFISTPSPTDRPVTGAPVTPAPVPETYKPTMEPEEGVAVSFILMGDVPYYTNHKYCLNEQLRELNPATMEYPYSFVVHVGDIKSGQTVDCVQEYYTDVADIFASPLNDFYYDTRDCFFLIGDNDWCDCNDPGSSFSYWMNSFGNGKKYNWINTGPNPNGFGTFSNANMRQTLEYDSDGSDSDSSYYASSATNFAFFVNQVLFVGINQVGGAEIGDESTRVRNNFYWVRSRMEKYAQQGMRTLVVFAHAPMSGARWEYFGQPFQSLLREYYPDILVLYAHGDGHEFNLDRIDQYNPNLYQMECDSGDYGDPLLISIIRQGSERDGLNVDRRGGTYPDGDCDPDNRDKTWSSNLF